MDVAGNVVDSLYGAGTSTTQITNHAAYDPNSSYLEFMKSTSASGTTTYQDLAYQWYAIGNLYTRASNPAMGNANTLSETFSYDLHNRLKTSTVTNAAGTQPMVSYQYDSVGDITHRTDGTGTTDYTYDSTHPHAVSTLSVSGTITGSYAYDPDGNMSCRDAASNSCTGTPTPNATWNSDGMPTLIAQGSANSSFSYAPDNHRYKQVGTDGATATTTLYLGGMEIVTVGSSTEYHHTLSAYGRPVMLDVLTSNTSGNPVETKSYLLTDHLGSVVATVDDAAGTPSEQSFDSFGRHRDPATWQVSSGSTSTLTKHGFTDQEHLDNLDGLVHMNGRVMDPLTGRFMSVDPMYQAPTNSQSINPYSYVMNNPLSLVDPTGYESVNSTLEETLAETTGGDNLGPDPGKDKKAKPKKPRKTNCGKDSYSKCLPTTTTGIGTHLDDWMPSAYCTTCRLFINDANGAPDKQQAVATTTPDAQSGNQGTASTTATANSQQQQTGCGASGVCLGTIEVDGHRVVRDAFGNGAAFLSLIFGGIENSIKTHNGDWLGQDMKYHPAAWGGNGAAGSRSVAYLDSKLAHGAGMATFIVTTGISLYDGYEDIKSGNYSDAALDMDDAVMGAMGAFGGKTGYGLSTAYFLGRGTGTFDKTGDMLYEAGNEIEPYVPVIRASIPFVP